MVQQAAARILPTTLNLVQNVRMPNPDRHMKKVLFGLCLLLSACDRTLPAWNAGKLVFIMPETAQGAKAEFESELAQLFARQLNASLETVTMPQNQVIDALNEHQAHLAAVSLRSEPISTALHYSPRYQLV